MGLSIPGMKGTTRTRILTVSIGFVIGATTLIGVWGLMENGQSRPPTQSKESRLDPGITYLPLSPTLAERYGLETASGALVTEVTSGGPGDRAGIVEGDIILSVDGTPLGERTPLLGIIRQCCTTQKVVVLEIRRGDRYQLTDLTLQYESSED